MTLREMIGLALKNERSQVQPWMKRKAGLPEPFSSYASFTPLCSMVAMGASS